MIENETIRLARLARIGESISELRARSGVRAKVIGDVIQSVPNEMEHEDMLWVAREFLSLVEQAGPRRGLCRFGMERTS